MENLFSMDNATLSKMLLSKLPPNAFEESARNYSLEDQLQDKCNLSKSIPGMSGLRPKVYLSQDLSVASSSALTARALCTIASEIFVNKNLDIADLSAWANGGFQFELKFVSKSFVESYSNSVQMIGLESDDEIQGLATLSPIRKLVLLHD